MSKWLDNLIKQALNEKEMEYKKLGIGNLFVYGEKVYCKRKGDAINIVDYNDKININENEMVKPLPTIQDKIKKKYRYYSILIESNNTAVATTVKFISEKSAEIFAEKIAKKIGNALKEKFRVTEIKVIE